MWVLVICFCVFKFHCGASNARPNVPVDKVRRWVTVRVLVGEVIASGHRLYVVILSRSCQVFPWVLVSVSMRYTLHCTPGVARKLPRSNQHNMTNKKFDKYSQFFLSNAVIIFGSSTVFLVVIKLLDYHYFDPCTHIVCWWCVVDCGVFDRRRWHWSTAEIAADLWRHGHRETEWPQCLPHCVRPLSFNVVILFQSFCRKVFTVHNHLQWCPSYFILRSYAEISRATRFDKSEKPVMWNSHYWWHLSCLVDSNFVFLKYCLTHVFQCTA